MMTQMKYLSLKKMKSEQIEMDKFLQNATQHLVFKAMLPGAISTKRSKQFWKEAHFYSNIIPALERFEEAANVPETERIDAFARYFCSRLSLNPGKIQYCPIRKW